MSLRQRKQNAAESVDNSKEKNSSRPGKISSERLVERRSSPLYWRKILGRIFVSFFMICAVYWTSRHNSQRTFASQKNHIDQKSHEVICSQSYSKEMINYSGCAPDKCGWLVTDTIITEGEAKQLLNIAKKGLAFGGSEGGASILDLHSGALSQGDSFIDIYKRIKTYGQDKVFTEQDFKTYRNVRNKIQKMVAYTFGLEANKLYLTHPTFFSEMTNKPPKSIHDEYWHVHVDKETYPSFHYTSLLYLSDYGYDFHGGKFVFVTKTSKNATIEPRLGRVSMFTSGAENPHYVERVTSGTRYALTVSFTCDKSYAIEDPSMEKLL